MYNPPILHENRLGQNHIVTLNKIRSRPASRCKKIADRAVVEVAFKKPTKVQILVFLVFFVSKNSNSFLNHILKVQKLELNNLNHIEFNHTLMTFPQSICL